MKPFDRVSWKGGKKFSWQGFRDNQDFSELGWSGRALVLTGMDWAGLDWGDLGWNGLDWTGLGKTRLDWCVLDWEELD